LYSHGEPLYTLGYIIGRRMEPVFKVIGPQHDDNHIQGHVASYYRNQGRKAVEVILKGIVPAARSAAKSFFYYFVVFELCPLVERLPVKKLCPFIE
jgi:hypothetical protein